MQFNTVSYLAFLALVVAVLWRLPARWRKGWLLLASYVFYATWHVEYVLLLGSVGLIAGFGGRFVLAAEGGSRRRRGVAVITVLVGILAAFKYVDWAISNVNWVLAAAGNDHAFPLLRWVLPLGVSFYTFEAISYVVECMRGKEKVHPHREFQLFFAFFPHLVAGPVLRTKELIPQFDSPAWALTGKRFADGIWLLASGLFLKNAVADRLAWHVDAAFRRDPAGLNAADALFTAVAFGLQIYLDFSAYSRLAIGSAKLCGIDLVENFNHPFAARTPGDFWNRWHMSLSRWIRDYLFFPIAGKRMKLGPMIAGALVSMGICGVWHGAGWTFVVWGLYHGLVLAVYYVGRALVQRRAMAAGQPRDTFFDSAVGRFISAALTWIGLLPSWILFRAPDLRTAGRWLSVMLSPWRPAPRALGAGFFLLVGGLMTAVWLAPVITTRIERHVNVLAEAPARRAAALQGALAGLLFVAALLAYEANHTFIYFQF